jgi:hypothetical protein
LLNPIPFSLSKLTLTSFGHHKGFLVKAATGKALITGAIHLGDEKME